jgi:chemotaxis signal transduction protein
MINSNLSPPAVEIDSALAHRFILTQVERFTLVFPATWIAEIIRIDRSQILDLPFYDPMLTGIVNYNGQITPLIASARLLEVAQRPLPERLVVVRLDRGAEGLQNVGLIVDRAIGSTNRQELPSELFSSNHSGLMVMMQSSLIPSNLWQPKYWSSDS